LPSPQTIYEEVESVGQEAHVGCSEVEGRIGKGDPEVEEVEKIRQMKDGKARPGGAGSDCQFYYAPKD
jgi:hypothetical protein